MCVLCCVATVCTTAPTAVTGGTYSCNSPSVQGDRCNATCSTGFVPSPTAGAPYVTCQSTGAWTAATGSCVRGACGLHGTVSNKARGSGVIASRGRVGHWVLGSSRTTQRGSRSIETLKGKGTLGEGQGDPGGCRAAAESHYLAPAAFNMSVSVTAALGCMRSQVHPLTHAQSSCAATHTCLLCYDALELHDVSGAV